MPKGQTLRHRARRSRPFGRGPEADAGRAGSGRDPKAGPWVLRRRPDVSTRIRADGAPGPVRVAADGRGNRSTGPPSGPSRRGPGAARVRRNPEFHRFHNRLILNLCAPLTGGPPDSPLRQARCAGSAAEWYSSGASSMIRFLAASAACLVLCGAAAAQDMPGLATLHPPDPAQPVAASAPVPMPDGGVAPGLRLGSVPDPDAARPDPVPTPRQPRAPQHRGRRRADDRQPEGPVRHAQAVVRAGAAGRHRSRFLPRQLSGPPGPCRALPRTRSPAQEAP